MTAIALSGLSVASGCAPAPGETLSGVTLSLHRFSDGQIGREIKRDDPIRIKAGSCYGWRLGFSQVKGDVAIEETLLLPSPSEDWDISSDTVLAADKMSARTRIVVRGLDGGADHSWCMSEGDPPGIFRIVLTYKRQKLGELRLNRLR